MAIEIIDFPINSMVIFYSYVSLPEGKTTRQSRQESFCEEDTWTGTLAAPELAFPRLVHGSLHTHLDALLMFFIPTYSGSFTVIYIYILYIYMYVAYIYIYICRVKNQHNPSKMVIVSAGCCDFFH